MADTSRYNSLHIVTHAKHAVYISYLQCNRALLI